MRTVFNKEIALLADKKSLSKNEFFENMSAMYPRFQFFAEWDTNLILTEARGNYGSISDLLLTVEGSPPKFRMLVSPNVLGSDKPSDVIKRDPRSLSIYTHSVGWKRVSGAPKLEFLHRILYLYFLGLEETHK